MGVRLETDHYETYTSLAEWMDERREIAAANLPRHGADDEIVAMVVGEPPC